MAGSRNQSSEGPTSLAMQLITAWAWRGTLTERPSQRTEIPADVEIRVWDSSAEVRYLVLPQRPWGTDGRSEEELAAFVTRDSMIGVAVL